MNIELLKNFMVVTEFMNFTKAADFLNITQPALSKQIAALEKSLGVTLLIRNNRSIHLTQAGTYLMQQGPLIIDKIDEVKSNIKKNMHNEILHISMSSFFFKSVIDIISRFQESFPETPISFHHLRPEDVVKSVIFNKAGIGVTDSFGITGKTTELSVLKLTKDHFCALVSEKNPLALKKCLKLSDLEGKIQFFLSNQMCDYFYEKCGTKPRNNNIEIMENFNDLLPHSFDSLLYQVRSGYGILLVPKQFAENNGSGCSILEIADAETTFDIVMLCRNCSVSPYASLFMDFFSKNYRFAEG